MIEITTKEIQIEEELKSKIEEYREGFEKFLPP